MSEITPRYGGQTFRESPADTIRRVSEELAVIAFALSCAAAQDEHSLALDALRKSERELTRLSEELQKALRSSPWVC